MMVVAPYDYQDKEFEIPRNAFDAAGHSIQVISKDVELATGSLGGSTAVDEDLSKAKAVHFDAVVFVGGRGAKVYFHDKDATDLAKSAFDEGKIVAAICIAPSILVNAGILSEKKVTAFPSEEGNLKAKGADYTGEAVQVDGNIVTGNGPEAAQEFADEILKLLKK